MVQVDYQAPKSGEIIIGYTHYWEQEGSFSQGEWENIATDSIRAIEFCENLGIELTSDYDHDEKAEISDSRIRFNGVGKDSHETFILEKNPRNRSSLNSSSGGDFNFCKTARKPYDLAVGLVLLITQKHAPNRIKVSSDGTWGKDEIDEDWTSIRRAFYDLFHERPQCPWKNE